MPIGIVHWVIYLLFNLKMILKAKHHRFIYPFFKWYTLWLVNGNFSKIHYSGTFTEKELPILLIANHSSWWDGFWALYLNIKVFKRKFHFMMLEEQLRKYWYFNYAGGFSVKKKSRSVLETLHYTSSLLADKNNLVLLFPQGEIGSVQKDSFDFEKGIERILAGVKNQVQIVFLVSLTDYFSSKKPEIFFYYREYSKDSFQIADLEEGYNRFYKSCKDTQSEIKR
jgi:1-acyl-sn-glycerol-3-phosphate acyltransferase